MPCNNILMYEIKILNAFILANLFWGYKLREFLRIRI